MDVSAFKPLEWVEREGESCTTEFVKQCEEKRENVCADVAETVCDVVPYTGEWSPDHHTQCCHHHHLRVHHGDGGAAVQPDRAGTQAVCGADLQDIRQDCSSHQEGERE